MQSVVETCVTQTVTRSAARRLYGRDREQSQLRAALGRGGLIVVQGPFGSGKSALIRDLNSDPYFAATILSAHLWSESMQSTLGVWRQIESQFALHRIDTSAISASPPEAQIAAALLQLQLETPGTPVRIHIDGLHLADQFTLDCLERLIELEPTIQIVAARRTDVPMTGSCAAILAQLMRRATVVELRPLTPTDVATWQKDLSKAADTGLSTKTLCRETGGSPLLLEALLEGSDEQFRHRIAAAVDHQLSTLSEPQRRLVELVAVEPGLDRTVLQSLREDGGGELHAQLAAIQTSGLLELDGGVLGFRHQSQRAATLQTIAASRQAQHRWDLSRHLLNVGWESDTTTALRILGLLEHDIVPDQHGQAIHTLCDIAVHLRSQHRLTEAEAALSRAYALICRFGGSPRLQCEVLVALAATQRDLGSLDADRTARLAVNHADRIGAPDLVGRSALVAARSAIGAARLVGGDPTAMARLRIALNTLGESEPALRCELLCALVVHGEEAATEVERTQALAQARRIADEADEPRLRVAVQLAASTIARRPASQTATSATATTGNFDASLPFDLALGVFLDRALHTIRVGDTQETLRMVEQATKAAAGLPQLDWALHRLRCTIALVLGDKAAAAGHAHLATERATGTAMQAVDHNDQLLRADCGLELGTGLSLGRRARSAKASQTRCTSGGLGYLPHRAHLAAQLAETDPTRSAELLQSVLARGPALFGTRHLVPTFASVARCAAALGDRVACERAVEVLLPYLDELVVLGSGAATNGTVRQAIAGAASLIGAENLVLTAPTMTRTVEGWTLHHDGKTAALPNLQGFMLIARLLSNHETAVPLLALADDHAYRRFCSGANELRLLETDLSEARSNHDYARLDSLQDRFDSLVTELSVLGGLDPTCDNTTIERTRVRVTKSIRTALGRLADIHPSAAELLDGAVQTGRMCSYTGQHSWTVHVDERR